jgi:hypothetical protein
MGDEVVWGDEKGGAGAAEGRGNLTKGPFEPNLQCT